MGIYRFTKCIIDTVNSEVLDSESIDGATYRYIDTKLRVKALNMIGDANEEMRECPFTGKEYKRKMYTEIKNVIQEVTKKYDGQQLPDQDAKIDKDYGYESPSITECVFWAFLLVDDKCKSGTTIFENLRGAAGIYAAEYFRMEYVILCFCLERGLPWSTWVSLNLEWRQARIEIDGVRSFKKWHSMPYIDFLNETEKGLNEHGETELTFLNVESSYREWIARCTDVESFKKMMFEDVDKVTHIDGAVWRRTWYLYRLISRLIDKQIDSIKNEVGEYYRWRENLGRRPEGEEIGSRTRRIMKLLENCVLQMSPYECAEKLTHADNFIQAESVLMSRRDNATMRIENLAETIDNSLCGSEIEPSVFLRASQRFIDQYSKIDASEDEIKKAWKRSSIEVPGITIDDLMLLIREGVDRKRNSRPLLIHNMSMDTETTKEMLLLMSLVVKSNDNHLISRDYIEQMLFNCRFDNNLDKDEPFLKFFNEAFSSINRLPELVMIFEKQEMKKGNGAVFRNIIQGKAV